MMQDENGEDKIVKLLERIGEKRKVLNILQRKASRIVCFLRRSCLLHDVIKTKITEIKEV